MVNMDEKHEWISKVQSLGYRLTAPRRVIIEIMASTHYALSPIDLYDQGRRQYPGLGLVTVYRTLEKLEELGLVQRVHQPGGCHMYIRAAQGHQHILLCQKCGQAVYFGGDNLNPLVTRLSTETGFTILEHWLQLFGTCEKCTIPGDA